MITQSNHTKENLNPFNSGIKEGISLITAIKNRQDTFEQALQTWVTHDEIDEIIIVDWGSDESLVPLVQKYQNGKIFLAIVKDQPKWVLSFAYNLAARLSSKDKLLKVDSDIKVLPDFFQHHKLTPWNFFTGNMDIARNDNEIHLNGSLYLYRNDFFKVNGYNEFITSYGWDDADIYLRIESQGLKRKNINPDDIYHIEHFGRTKLQNRTRFVKGVDDKERSILNTLINQQICSVMPGWSPAQPMLDFDIRYQGLNLCQCVASAPSSVTISSEIAINCERLALIERLTNFQITFDPEIQGLLTRDELRDIYSVYLSTEKRPSDKNLLEVVLKLNNLLHEKNRLLQPGIQLPQETYDTSTSGSDISSADKPVIEWADIPAGMFIMGSPESEEERYDDEKQHQVTLGAFRMSICVITVGQFKTFVDATRYITDAEKGTGQSGGSVILEGSKWNFKAGVNWKCDVNGNPRPVADYNNPVIHVSWNDANAFAEWMNCRLPTESEWEYACRAGTSTPFNTGSSLSALQANYNGNYPYTEYAKGEYRARTMPVGSFAPNAWGLNDMHGNVMEWCSDWYGDYPDGPQTDPKGPSTGSDRVYRGGSWAYDARNCRSANRSSNAPGRRGNNMGFRLVSPV